MAIMTSVYFPLSLKCVLFLFYLDLFRLVECSLIKWPNNAETVVGEKFRLQCSTSQPYEVIWEHVKYGGHVKEFIYFDGVIIYPYSDRYQIVRDDRTGQYDLEISFVQLEDSGKFRCIEMEGLGETREAQLTVLENHPKCSCKELVDKSRCHTSKPENIEVHCQVAYAGNIVPALSCYDLTGFVGMEREEISTHVVRYVMTFRFDPHVVHSNYTCYTNISRIPSASFSADFTNVRAVHRKQMTIYHPGVVNCSLKGTRECHYKWMKSNQIVGHSQSLTITEPGVYRCEGGCHLGGKVCKLEPVEVEFLRPEGSTAIIIAPVVIVVIVDLLVAIAVIST